MAERILLVEDEKHLAIGIQFNLEQEGYEVTTVGDGRSALDAFHADNAIQLVILDIMLPSKSGYVVCESIRDAGSDVPILLLSARTLSEDRSRGFDVGANQYLTKPFELTELLSRVRNLLNQNGRRGAGSPAGSKVVIPAGPKVVRFHDAEVNFDTHEVLVRGEEVKMTALELKLLKYLLDNAGRVVSRDELLEEVWEVPAQLNTRAPDQFIRRLRKIFEQDASKPEIFLTVRDAGYRMIIDE